MSPEKRPAFCAKTGPNREPRESYALYERELTLPPRPVQFVWKNWPRGLEKKVHKEHRSM